MYFLVYNNDKTSFLKCKYVGSITINVISINVLSTSLLSSFIDVKFI